MSDRMRPPSIVVMGVSGTGKSTVGHLLAERLDLPFEDGDDLHSPANVAKMAAGVPLTDADRAPWLEAVGRWLHEHPGGVIACSALKKNYRDRLRVAAPEVFFLHLTADRDQLIGRMDRRRNHYMPASLVDSQLATLEPLEPGERGAALPTDRTPERTVDAALELVRNHSGTM